MLSVLIAPLLSLQLLCDTSAPTAIETAGTEAQSQRVQAEVDRRRLRIIRSPRATLRTDTLIVVRKGMSFELDNFSGVINVNAWTRDAVRVQAEHSRRDEIVAEFRGKTLTVEAENRLGMPSFVNYHLTLPEWMPIVLSGINAEIAINNMKGSVSAESVSGDVLVRGTTGTLELSSIEGTVRVMDAKGRVDATSVNNEVRLERIAGAISCESVNGSIRLEQLDSQSVSASSMNGMVLFVGDFKAKGHYSFTSHMGNIVVGVPEDAALDVSMLNFQGGFRSGFPLKAGSTPKQGTEFNFTLGSGGSTLDLESYQGMIQLLRPLELKAKLERLAPLAAPSPRSAPNRVQVPAPAEAPETPEPK